MPPVSEGNRKDIRTAVEAVHRAVPRYVTDWLWNGCVHVYMYCSCVLRHFRVCNGGGVVTYLPFSEEFLACLSQLSHDTVSM